MLAADPAPRAEGGPRGARRARVTDRDSKRPARGRGAANICKAAAARLKASCKTLGVPGRVSLPDNLRESGNCAASRSRARAQFKHRFKRTSAARGNQDAPVAVEAREQPRTGRGRNPRNGSARPRSGAAAAGDGTQLEPRRATRKTDGPTSPLTGRNAAHEGPAQRRRPESGHGRRRARRQDDAHGQVRREQAGRGLHPNARGEFPEKDRDAGGTTTSPLVFGI